MIRSLLRRLLRAVLGLFFRRIEVIGRERVPDRGPVMFAINHPNALVDACQLLAFAPRPVAFLAKAPILRMPVIGTLARALDTIPVYRRQDPGTDMAWNRETFDRARRLLDGGGAIAIAPEGTSHSAPRLKPLKTGAARMALGVRTAEQVLVIPVGLFYSAKGVFRSVALVWFGDPIPVATAPVDESGEPPAERVRELTEAIQAGLAALLPQADEHDALALAGRVERLLQPDRSRRSVAEAVAVRQRLLAGYRRLRAEEPEELARLAERAERLEALVREVAIKPAHLSTRHFTAGAIAGALAKLVARVLIVAPLAIPGALVHWPAYRLVGWLAKRVTRPHPDVLATAKIIGAAVLYPLTWMAVAIAAGRLGGWVWGVAALLLTPLAGFAALRVGERLEGFRSASRALAIYGFEPWRFRRLLEDREALRRDLLAMADRLGV
ncbi:MAG: 1-acyl-sn-glycerol-3-phosphate acyltransferase [Gemmatimonadales bacterium]